MPNEREDEAYLNPAAADLQGFEDGEEEAYATMYQHRFKMQYILGWPILIGLIGIILYIAFRLLFS